MALRNITNNSNFLKKLTTAKSTKHQTMSNKNEQFIHIENLACSPGRKKYTASAATTAIQRTSSPIQQQPHQQKENIYNKVKAHSAAIAHIKTNLKEHESRRMLKEQKKYSKSQTSSRSRSSKNERKLNAKCNGMLKVALYNNCGLMTVHVIQARNLRLATQNERLDTYARVTMLPDVEQRLKCQTTIIKDSKNPIFDEKFSFEFDENDFQNRLLISIWSKNLTSCAQADHLIGCFSFKIKHLMKRDNMNVCSWYYILPSFELGSSKHYKVKLSRNYNLKIQQEFPLHQLTAPPQPPQQQQQQLTEVNKDIIGLNKLRVCIDRNEVTNDFGFTISGSCPCIVSKVDPEKAAFVKGLRPGDFIVKIHEINVSRATCESVVKLIKNCKSKLVMEVYRDKSQVKIRSKRNINDEITAQHINQLYFNNNSTATDTTTSTASLSAVNTDFSGKSIDLPQYNLKLYSLNEINSTKTTATTATTDNDSFVRPAAAEAEEEEDEDDDDFYYNLVPSNVELNEIPFVDEEEDFENDDLFVCQQQMVTSATYCQQNTKVGKSRLLIKNEARTRTPLIAATNYLDDDYSSDYDNLPVIEYQNQANFI